ncbi:Gpr1 family protein [Suillus subalutaceus]|uniref:Gpr1 family protein n=1 Tax=Suillus subalutaceus TaxID=48586 RepID=UPI001B87D1E9|nr:Gpr1 family protein [Suillus subalutaceus]KAG1835399.1 Gpr1 family protein [Suillus subalutaceus]KAG1880099.1 Gpr1 family protein [Suillus subluteus]
MSDVEKANSTHQNYAKAYGPPPTRIANPGALGLFSFASTTFILSLYNVNARGVVVPNVVVGMACFCGGLAQLLAGMWEFPRGNVFGATAFTSYGAFWMSYATIFIPDSGIVAAYGTNTDELNQALGIYLITWFVFTFLLMLGALRRNISFIALLFFLCITFVLLAVGIWTNKLNVSKAGGAFGILTAMIAYYCALSELLVKGESWFTLPMGTIKQERVD